MDRANKDESKLADHELTSGGTEKARREGERLKGVVFALVKDEYFYNLLISNHLKDKKAKEEFNLELQKYYRALDELNNTASSSVPAMVVYPLNTQSELEARLINLIKEVQSEIRSINKYIDFLTQRIEENSNKKNNILSEIKQFFTHAFSDNANYDNFESSLSSKFMSKQEFGRIGRELCENILSQMDVGIPSIEVAINSHLQEIASRSVLDKIDKADLAALYVQHIKHQDGYEAYANLASDYVEVSRAIETDKIKVSSLLEKKGALEGLLGSLGTQLHNLHQEGEISESLVAAVSAAKESIDKRASISLEPSSRDKMKTVDNIFVDNLALKSNLKHYEDPFADDVEPTLNLDKDQVDVADNEFSKPRMR